MKIRNIICILLLILTGGFCANAVTYSTVEEAYDIICDAKGEDMGTYFTRGEFLSLLMECMGYNKDIYVCSFSDVYDLNWQYTYIANAENREIAFGCYDGQFYPDRYITAEEAVTFISRTYKIQNTYDENEKVNLTMSEYSKGYIMYAIKNNLYPIRQNTYVPADDYLTVEECKKLINAYKNIEDNLLKEVDFLYGYPKPVGAGSTEYISIALKSNKPCKVYYDIKETDKVNSEYVPEVESLDKLLGEVPYEDYEIKLMIKAEQNVMYNIYLVAVDDYGNKGRIYTLKNISVLPYTQGNGTLSNPYKIYTAYQLEQIRYYPDKAFLLCNDIEYNGQWEPVGNVNEQSSLFTGVFDGGGYSITGLEIKGEDNIGMFSILFGGTVKNLSVEAQAEGNNYVGIIAGESEGGLIEKCHTSGNVRAKENIAGGIVGKNNGVIKNCLSVCYYVESLSYSGGIAGNNSGDISECLSCVTHIYSDMYASGIAGINIDGVIKSCAAASREVTDTLTKNSGRITTNRENGRTENNYAYQEMVSGTTAYIGSDLQDGEEASWEDLTGQTFYVNKLRWDFRNIWTINRNIDFIMPVIRTVNVPKLTPGVTVYMPYGIYNEQQLRDVEKNKQYHYVLKNDITLSDNAQGGANWIPIGMAYDEENFVEDAFCGTFDGNGHTIKNIKMVFDESIFQYGFFGMLYGATVRNLSLENMSIEGHSNVAFLAAVNYGIIENCSVSGTMNAYSYNKETMAGGICSVNYTNIYSCDVKGNIIINALSSNVGGIAAYNEGFVNDASFNGNIESVSVKNGANSVVGNIVGINYSGYIYNCFGEGRITSHTDISYCGGISGMQNGGEIYKCSSKGNIYIKASEQRETSAYSGGLAGLISGGLIMNSFTADNINMTSHNSFAGGIAGYCENANIQNVYGVNTISQQGGISNINDAQIFAGGITGYSMNGNISGTVVLNPSILTNGSFGMITAFSQGGYVDNNYYISQVYTKSQASEQSVTGNEINHETAENMDFYFTSIADGGVLGWINTSFDDVWTVPSGNNYQYPVLSGVKGQSEFNTKVKY